MNEIWKDIEGYEGLYMVSDKGNVKSLDKYVHTVIKHQTRRFIKGRLLTNKKLPQGYLFVIFSRNGKGKMHLIHRLVAKAFIPNPENKPDVNHIDFDKGNNNISNLEWVTAKENTQHALDGNKMWIGERCNLSKISEKEVLFIRSQKGLISGKTLAKQIGMSDTNVYDIWKRRTWKHI